MGQAAALTGGYGSSYAQNVGQQAYNSYLQQLGDVVPELYQLAYDRYADKGDRLYKTYQNWSQLEQQAAQQEQWEREYELAERERQDANRRFELEQEQENSQTQTSQTQTAAYQPDYWASLAAYHKLGQNNSTAAVDNTAAEPAYDNGKVSEGNIKTMQRVLGLQETGKWTDDDRTGAGGLTADKAWEYYQKGQLQNYKSVGLGLDIGNIKTMERVLGLEEDGYWSKEDQKAAGGLTAYAAWKDYQKGKLQSRSRSGMSMEEWADLKKKQSSSSNASNTKENTPAVQNFIAGTVTEDQAAERGVNSTEWKMMVKDRLNRENMTMEEFEQLEKYYGLDIPGGSSAMLQDNTANNAAQKMSYTEYRKNTAAQKVDDLNAGVQRFFRDYQAFVNSAVYDLQNVGYQNAESMLKNREGTAKKLQKQAEILASALRMNGDIIAGDCSELIAQIVSTKTGIDSIMDAFDGGIEYYSRWATEEDYNSYLTTQEQLSADPDALRREIAQMENLYTVYEDLVTREIGKAEEAKLAQLRQQYPTLGDLEASIEEKKEYLNTVIELQAQAKQADERAKEYYDKWGHYLEADDFAYYSAKGAAIKNPTMRDAEGDGRFLWWAWEGDEIGNIVTYSRENADMLAIAYANGENTKGKYKYRSMTNEEVEIYNYLLAKEGKDKAGEFLSFLDEELNAREGGALAEQITGIDIPVVEDLAIALFGVGAGIDQWASGTRQLFTNELQPTTIEQYANAEIAASLTGVGKYAHTGANVIGNMVPSIPLSSVTAGAGAPAAVAQGVGAAAVGISAAGNAYGSALRDGYSVGQARAYSTLIGAAEGTLQYILGGIGSLGGITDDLIKLKINMIDNSLLRISAKLGVDIFSEVAEEELQNFLEPAFRSIIFGEKYDAPTIDEMLETAIVTAGTTLILGGSGTVSEDLSENRQFVESGQKIMGIDSGLDTLMNSANEVAGVSSEDVRNTLTTQIDKVNQNPTARNVGQLYATVQTANNQANAVANQTNTVATQAEVAESLKGKAIPSWKIDTLAEAIIARANDQELTRTQREILSFEQRRPSVQNIISDLMQKKTNGIDSAKNRVYDDSNIRDGLTNEENAALQNLSDQGVDSFRNHDHGTVIEGSALHQLQNEFSDGSYEGGASASRPTWRQSELDAAADFPDYDAQKSFINGEEVPYGTKGSVRPDYYKAGFSVDIKNYNVESASGRSNLVRNIEKQHSQRTGNLPNGTKQAVIIDVRGQNVSISALIALYNDIIQKTHNGVEILFKMN